MSARRARRTEISGVHKYRGYIVERTTGGYHALDAREPHPVFAEVIAQAHGFDAIKKAVDKYIGKKMVRLAEEYRDLDAVINAAKAAGLDASPTVRALSDRRSRSIAEWEEMNDRVEL